MDRTSDWAGDALPGSTPEAQDRAALDAPRPEPSRDYTDAPGLPPREYQWALTASHINIHETEPHERLFAWMGHIDFSRPYAYGALILHDRWDAVFMLGYTNMGFHLVEKRLKRYCREQGWKYAGLTDEDGNPYEETKLASKTADAAGMGPNLPQDKSWRHKDWSGLEQHDQPADTLPIEGAIPDDPDPEKWMRCSECGMPCPDYNSFRLHTLREHVNPNRDPATGPEPVVDYDDVLPADFNTLVMDPSNERKSNIWKLTYQPTYAPKIPQAPAPQGPIPFIFDIGQDRIFAGFPGERHSDIQGRFTPGGIVEGLYTPKGELQIRTDTDMPFTIFHMLELWGFLNPHLPIKSLWIMVGDKRERIASAVNIGQTVRTLAAADTAAWHAYEALRPLGNVYAVGGVVRDVVLGKIPNDIDLMVQGVNTHEIHEALARLPGKLDYTGKHFGVFRYKEGGHEVEIAMPRTEESTGDKRKDFDVMIDGGPMGQHADFPDAMGGGPNPFLPIGRDLARRDFTGNAMAVNLDTGDLIDPYKGVDDLMAGRLHTVNDTAFQEDATRILRALAMVSKHKLDPSPEVYQMMKQYASTITSEASQRLGEELVKIMSGDNVRAALELALDTGVMTYLIPEVAATVDFDQRNKNHKLPLHEHLLEVLEAVADHSPDVDLRLVALLHDIGKPASQWIDDEGQGHYYHQGDKAKPHHGEGLQHEDVGADMARSRLAEFNVFGEPRLNRMDHLIRNHMFDAFTTESGARRFRNRMGDEHADDLLALRNADAGGKGYAWDGDTQIMRQLVQRARDADHAVNRHDLAVKGNDLLELRGEKQGPWMTDLNNYLLNHVLEYPDDNNRERLLELAREWQPGSRVASILDDIHDSLDPKVFVHPESDMPDVKPEIVDFIRAHVHKLMIENGWPDPSKYMTMVLTGSMTTYQWDDESDCDVSLWIDVREFPEYVRAELIRLMIHHMDGTEIPGTRHPLQCFVTPLSVTREQLYKPGLRSAYDLEERRWLVLPERSRSIDVYREFPAILRYAKMCADKMRMMLKYDHIAAKIYWHFLHELRRRDQSAGKGDYAESNIVYKYLSKEGLFPQISEAIGEYIGHTADWPTFGVGDIVRFAWSTGTAPEHFQFINGEVLGQSQGPDGPQYRVKTQQGTYGNIEAEKSRMTLVRPGGSHLVGDLNPFEPDSPQAIDSLVHNAYHVRMADAGGLRPGHRVLWNGEGHTITNAGQDDMHNRLNPHLTPPEGHVHLRPDRPAARNDDYEHHKVVAPIHELTRLPDYQAGDRVSGSLDDNPYWHGTVVGVSNIDGISMGITDALNEQGGTEEPYDPTLNVRWDHRGMGRNHPAGLRMVEPGAAMPADPEQFPDTVPWDEAGQDYYRNAKTGTEDDEWTS